MQTGIGLGNLFELDALIDGEVLGVLPERVTGSGDASRGARCPSAHGRVAAVVVAAGRAVPCAATLDVEGFDRPRNDMNGPPHPTRPRAAQRTSSGVLPARAPR